MEPLPCPFCGSKPVFFRGKVRGCQLHGDPMQDVFLRCNSSRCEARPTVRGGDVFNGEDSAKAIAVAAWNKRA